MDENTSAAVETTETAEAAPNVSELQAELDRLRTENGRLKNAQSNASADAAKYKKELRDRMSEQDRVAAETKDLIEQLKADNAALKRSQTLAEYEAGFIGQGFDKDLAKRAAEATHDQNFSDLMSVVNEFMVAHDKALAENAMRSVPRPGAGDTGVSITKEQFDNMEYAERLRVYEDAPELYKQYTGKS